jgi:hypothetical protein
MEHYSANYAINRFKWQSYVRHHEIGLWFDLTEKGLAAAKAWAEERLAEVAQAKAARDTAKPHYNWRQWRYWFRPASPKPVQSKPVRSYPVPPTLEQIKARFTLVGTVDLGEDQQWEVI